MAPVKVLATYSIKGGVGKTATAVNLAYLAAAQGAKVLLWDLDPQAAATFYFRVEPKIKGGGRKLVHRKRRLEDQIKGTDFEGLDLVPADFSYRHLDLDLDDVKKPLRRISKLLRPLLDEYDYVFLDCAPSISIVSESVFRAADALLVPVIPTPLSLRTLDQLLGHVRRGRPDDPAILPFYCMVDRRKSLHREVIEGGRRSDARFLESIVPYSTWVERMGLERAPIAEFARHTVAAKAYRELWWEVCGRGSRA